MECVDVVCWYYCQQFKVSSFSLLQELQLSLLKYKGNWVSLNSKIKNHLQLLLQFYTLWWTYCVRFLVSCAPTIFLMPSTHFEWRSEKVDFLGIEFKYLCEVQGEKFRVRFLVRGDTFYFRESLALSLLVTLWLSHSTRYPH